MMIRTTEMTYRFLLVASLIFAPFVCATPTETIKQNGLELNLFYGKRSTVNAYLFSDGKELILLDALDSVDDARQLKILIDQQQLPLKQIFISHGHPDHFIGLAVLNRAFPNAEIVVASEGIKQELIGWANWMTERGWMHISMIPKSEKAPRGFDYERLIKVTSESQLAFDSGKTLRIDRGNLPTETVHYAMLYSEDLHGLFMGDLASNKVHLWLGEGVDTQSLENWQTLLAVITKRYQSTGVTIYPGHGKPAPLSLLREVSQYIDVFKFAIRTGGNQDAVQTKMMALFPDYSESGYLPFGIEQHLVVQTAKADGH
ncbi:MBL fold metallo-hydrolase [Corallincola holothuriorum]|uniref:MBL fold metallo-hydrolase n=2 Tax=Corallincola holothuriorum TaxID=2282215 RepID=A0A368NGL3_9GAMM|nr:MBL fold metallo-hydrolase [Corallincola holothuriorum]